MLRGVRHPSNACSNLIQIYVPAKASVGLAIAADGVLCAVCYAVY